MTGFHGGLAVAVLLATSGGAAAADGAVSTLIDYEPGCGVGVVLSHPRFECRQWMQDARR